MKIYDTRSAIKAFYYLMAIDGEIGADELIRFNEIGSELDKEHFQPYKDEIAAECQKQITCKDADDDFYDILQEGIDAALSHEASGDDMGITPRLLVWNLLAVAFSNDEYDTAEKKLIAHVARVSGVEKSILLEMEQFMQTANAVQQEKDLVQQMNRPYAEIRPIVEELEKRLSVISDSAKALIEDEVALDSPYMYKPDFFDKTKAMLDDAISPVAHKIGEKTRETSEAAIHKISPIVKQAKGKTLNLMGKLASKLPSKEEKQDEEDT